MNERFEPDIDPEEVAEEMRFERVTARPTGEKVSFGSVVIDERSVAWKQIADILRNFDKGLVYQEDSSDSKQLQGWLDTRGAFVVTVTSKETGETISVSVAPDNWHYKH
jgi:hypothetical protein